MKIKVTQERECCQASDLKPVVDAPKINFREPTLKFCIHCGRRHEYYSFMDGAGSRDWDYRRVKEDWD